MAAAAGDEVMNFTLCKWEWRGRKYEDHQRQVAREHRAWWDNFYRERAAAEAARTAPTLAVHRAPRP
jgi:hypothetical protein